MRIITILLALLITISSCSEHQESHANTEDTNINNTPNALTEVDDNSSYRVFSKKHKGDIIEMLYNEAIEKNEKLQNLDAQISAITRDSTQEKTKAYLNYKNTNNDYWSVAKMYIEHLNDSTTKQTMLALFERLKSKHDDKMLHHEQKMEHLEHLKKQLDDQITLMQLFVTAPMMSNYQDNEFPDIEALESIIKDYKETIKETEAYTKETK